MRIRELWDWLTQTTESRRLAEMDPPIHVVVQRPPYDWSKDDDTTPRSLPPRARNHRDT